MKKMNTIIRTTGINQENRPLVKDFPKWEKVNSLRINVFEIVENPNCPPVFHPFFIQERYQIAPREKIINLFYIKKIKNAQ